MIQGGALQLRLFILCGILSLCDLPFPQLIKSSFKSWMQPWQKQHAKAVRGWLAAKVVHNAATDLSPSASLMRRACAKAWLIWKRMIHNARLTYTSGQRIRSSGLLLTFLATPEQAFWVMTKTREHAFRTLPMRNRALHSIRQRVAAIYILHGQ